MESQTNYPPQQPAPANSSSGANTVLLVVVIIILGAFGYWWYSHRGVAPAPAKSPDVNVQVTLPAGDGSTASDQPAQ